MNQNTKVTVFKPSLIVNTFRKPKELARVLDAIACGTRLPHEVILAEDDTNPELSLSRNTFAHA